jgi:glycosyltransferase involved in cell wall biosynthesis
MLTLTIIIVVKNPLWLDEFIKGNKKYLTTIPVIVIDSGGGEKLKEYCKHYIQKDVSLWEARKIGYEFADTEFIMNLDGDVIIPDGYIDEALFQLGRCNKIGAVSIFYDKINSNRGVLEYGCSIWRRQLAKQLYDYNGSNGICECLYMWDKLQRAGWLIETTYMRAKHLRC